MVRSGRWARVCPSHRPSQRARAHVHATPPPCSQGRARIVRHARSAAASGTAPITGSAQPSRAQVHREPHACEDAGDGRQDGAAHGHPGVDDRRFKQQLPSAAVLFTRQAAPHHVTGASQQGRPSRWRVSSAPGGRSPRTTVTPSLRLRFRHLTTSDITRLAAHAAVSSRCLEQRATRSRKRPHGRHGQQLPLRLRRGQLLRPTRREPPLPSPQ